MTEMMTAKEALAMSMDNGADEKVEKKLGYCMKYIRKAAQRGERAACLCFDDSSRVNELTVRRLREQGFEVRLERDVSSGVLQDPCYYARW